MAINIESLNFDAHTATDYRETLAAELEQQVVVMAAAARILRRDTFGPEDANRVAKYLAKFTINLLMTIGPTAGGLSAKVELEAAVQDLENLANLQQ